ncbi:reverse transcriptase domain-containing protein [Tanacetum coccineum]
MQTRSSSKFIGEPSTNPTSTNPKRRNRRRSKQRVEPFALEETPVVTIADQRTMAELLRANPPEGVTSTLKYKDMPETSIKLNLFPFSIDGLARIWLDKEPSRSILTWDDLVSKFINHFFPPSKTTNLLNEISNFQQKFEETFSESWDRFKDLLRACPHHGFTKLHQLDTFYNGLNPSDQDSLNYAAGGNLLERSAQDLLKIIENKSKVRNSRNKPIISQVKASNVDSSEIASAVTSAMTAMFKQHQVTPSPAFVKAVKESSPIDEPVVAPKLKPSIPYPSRANKQKLREKDDNLALKFVEIFQELHFELSFADALLHMPKFASMFKSLLNNKEKLFDLAKKPMNENCLAVILKKLPEKLGDPSKFLIPCDFLELVECLALADLGASINLMPLSIWKKLSLPELTPTRMILELADQKTTSPSSIAEDTLFEDGTCFDDFMVRSNTPDFDDEALTLKLGPILLRYSYNNSESVNRIDVIDVSCEEYVQEVLGFSDSSKSGNLTPILSTSFHSLTLFEGGDFILEEIKACLTNDSIPPGIDDADFDLEGDLLLLEKLLNDT